MKKLHCLLLAFLLALSLPSAYSQNSTLSDTLFVDSAATFPLNAHLFYYEDVKREGLPAAIQKNKQGLFKPTENSVLSKGYTQSNYWITFTLKNRSSNFISLIFRQGSSSVNKLLFYEIKNGAVKAYMPTGDHFAYNHRPIINRSFLFPIKLQPGEAATYYLMADKRGQNMYMPMSLSREDVVWQAEIPKLTLYGFYCGIMLFAILFNLFLLFSLKDKIHLFYSLYVFCTLIFSVEEEGLGFAWFYPTFPFIQDYMRPLMAALGTAFIIQVMQLFLSQKRDSGIFFIVAESVKYACYFLTPVILVFFFIHPPVWAEKLVFYSNLILSFLGILIAFGSGIQKIISGYKPAWYYTVAITALFIGAMNYIFNTLGITNVNIFKPNGLVFGSTIEIILLAFALTQRYNFFKNVHEGLLLEKNELQVKISEQIIKAQEDERTRLARDLHDDLGGTLSAIKLNVTGFHSRIIMMDENLQGFYFQTVSMIDKACSDLRDISHNLMPGEFTSKGLVKTISEHVEQVNRSGETHFRFIYSVNNVHFIEVFEKYTYMIIRELIHNIVKHSRATDASIQLIVFDNYVQIVAEDNGLGFEFSENGTGIGIRNIYSRTQFLNGKVSFDSNHRGTTVLIELPYAKKDIVNE